MTSTPLKKNVYPKSLTKAYEFLENHSSAKTEDNKKLPLKRGGEADTEEEEEETDAAEVVASEGYNFRNKQKSFPGRTGVP